MTWAAGAGNMYRANGPFELAAARSLVEGLTQDVKFGRNPDISTAIETIWAHTGLYAYQAAATKLKVSSGSADDDKDAGTGMRSVRLFGLDANWAEITEDVDIDGQDQTETDALFLRVYRAQGLTYGSGETNAGIIYAGTGSAVAGVPQTTVDLVIAAGKGQSEMCIRPVPAGKTMFISCIHFSVGDGKTLSAELVQRPFGGGFLNKWSEQIFQAPIERNVMFGPFAAKSDVELRGTSSASGTAVSGGFEYLLIDDAPTPT